MKFQRSLFVVLFVLIFALSACAPAATEEHTSAPHWTYEGEEGPAHWGDLDASYSACGTGENQSPIDVSAPTDEDLSNIAFYYQPSEVNILNNGHTVQVNYDSGSYIELDGVRYDVAQFHFHAPSEHSVDGKLFAAEIHIVHKSADGALAVVGILLEEGAQNASYAPFTDNLPAEQSEASDAGVQINAADMLPAEQTTYRYSGSLTTPPCSEGVNWLLMTTPVQVSAEQLHALESLFEGGNNRPVQPLNDRTLVEDNTP
ncbi:MAG: carbonic anhydrase family protein [Anaerolineales bacterium]|nr:carbonic anhydrase family protein [Anaerolineales bacterium]MCB9146099.1 carbonic anhydrase family protein [Anaerolineales bacterium]